MVEVTGDDIFESVGGDDSPMRLNGSSASSASVASRLYGTRSRRDSLGSDGGELISFSDQEMHENYLTREAAKEYNSDNADYLTMTSISKQMAEMQEKQQMGDDERNRLKTENMIQAERMHVLEEQLIEERMRFEDLIAQERQRSQEKLKIMEREREMNVENTQLKYDMLERELQMTKKELERSNQENMKLLTTVESQKSELQDNKYMIDDLEEERLKIERQFRKFKEEAKQDIDSSSEMVEQLTAETEELKKKTHGGRSFSIAEHMGELEECLDHARAEIRNLQKERDELQNQLLAASVERGHSLLADTPSLAEELVGGDSTQLLEALKDQEVCNQKLKVYISGILNRVMLMHPEILEVNCADSDSSS